MLKILYSIVLIAAFIPSLKCQINWTGYWAFACDFNVPINDLASANVPGEQCSNKCAATPKCTHFTWTNLNGGTCWMKKGTVNRNDAIFTNDYSMVCGVLVDVQALKGAILWQYEFVNRTLSLPNWIQQVGGSGWGNNELQFYTDKNLNIDINSVLSINTRLETKNTNKYTSARLLSTRKFRYGVFEMRARLPYGRGMWPAFWLLAAKTPLSWPNDGEIDIMEHVGYEPDVIHATIHCQSYNHMINTQIGKSTKVNKVSSEYHLYQLYWSDKSIRAYVDNQLYFDYERPKVSNYSVWPFDNEFNVILNTAVGGNWGGVQGVDDNIFPQRYDIDYIRQYSLR